MWNICEEVKKAAETVNVQITEIQNTEYNEIIENVKNKYCPGGGEVPWEKNKRLCIGL